MITIQDAVAALTSAREEKGFDFVYQRFVGQGCAYVHYTETFNEDGSSEKVDMVTGCMVGNALHRLGVPLEEFVKDTCTSINAGKDAYQACTSLRARGVIEYVDGVVEVFQAAQEAQDAGETWGEALAAAKARAYDILVRQGKI